jgi:hypothetical protein
MGPDCVNELDLSRLKSHKRGATVLRRVSENFLASGFSAAAATAAADALLVVLRCCCLQMFAAVLFALVISASLRSGTGSMMLST